jgi:hypothetical protein
MSTSLSELKCRRWLELWNASGIILMSIIPYILPKRRALSYLRRVYLRCARIATNFRHFLAYLSYILAQELQNLTKKGDGKRKRVLYHATPYYVREPIR